MIMRVVDISELKFVGMKQKKNMKRGQAGPKKEETPQK